MTHSVQRSQGLVSSIRLLQGRSVILGYHSASKLPQHHGQLRAAVIFFTTFLQGQSSDASSTPATGSQTPTTVLKSTQRTCSRRRRQYEPLAEFEAAAEKAAAEKALAARVMPSRPPVFNQTFAAIVKGGPRQVCSQRHQPL